MASRQARERSNVRRVTVKVHRGEGPCAARDPALDLRWVEGESGGVDIREDRFGPNGDCHRCRRHESEVGHDDFIAWLKQCSVGELERRSPGADGHRKACPDRTGEALLEVFCDPTRAKSSALQNSLDRVQFVLVERYLCYGNPANGTSSVACSLSPAILCCGLGFGKGRCVG